MSGYMRFAMSPATPVAPRLASPNRVLDRGPDGVLFPPRPTSRDIKRRTNFFSSLFLAFNISNRCGLSCGSILLCDTGRMAAQALAEPIFFVSQKLLEEIRLSNLIGPAKDAKERDPPRDEVRRENRAHEQPFDQDRKAKSNRRKARTG